MHLGRSWLLDRWAVGPFFYYYSGHRGLPNEQRPLSSGLVVRDLRSDILTPVTPSLTPVCQKIASTSSLLFSPISPSLWYCAPRIQGASKCIRYKLHPCCPEITQETSDAVAMSSWLMEAVRVGFATKWSIQFNFPFTFWTLISIGKISGSKIPWHPIRNIKCSLIW